ncbi:hypothetical protein Ciccas_003286 [Cichlidogyrus casuarinus]|uniref:Leucine-rich repeat-containing protein 58 n=1 Tax=Cichlidogyrus casuarinus TaxID=1844966 RepID=A0ABD2QEU4_9PLAT
MQQVQEVRLQRVSLQQVPDWLQGMMKLQSLDISGNALACNQVFARQLSERLVHLCLAKNNIANCSQLLQCSFPRLKHLDLAHNLILKFGDLINLQYLPNLQLLYLHGNPITIHPYYRRNVFICLGKRYQFVSLDSQTLSESEKYLVDLHCVVTEQFFEHRIYF